MLRQHFAKLHYVDPVQPTLYINDQPRNPVPTNHVILSAILISCNGFLDMNPTDSSNASEAIGTVEDAKVSLSGIKRDLTTSSLYGRRFILYGDVRGGDVTIYSTGRGEDALYLFNHTPTSGTYSGFWEGMYNSIMQVNSLLLNINSLEENGKSGFSWYKGSALALRAMLYFDLVRLYGLPYNMDKASLGVPDVTKPLDALAQPTRATVEENYSRIMSDLDAALPLLAKDKSHVNGYMDYYAALAVRTRVELFMDNYSAALKDAEEIIGSGSFSLYEPSEWVGSWARQHGTESILELGIDTESNLGSYSFGFYYMRYQQVKGASGWFLASDYFLSRLGQDPDDMRWGIIDNDEYYEDTGAQRKGACYKYLGSTSLDGDGKESYTAVNIKLIRLSEIYLIAAECALRTGNAASAAKYLNAIRRRSPNLAPADASTVSYDMILDERSKELFGEGLRFFDLIRMNRSIEYNDDFQNIPVSTRPKVIDRNFGKIVLPIPQDEINANPAIASQQNPAYR